MKHHIGQRLSYDGYLCTIRWIGKLPVWPDIGALGVEWDRPEKGRHSGCLNGIQYFECIIEGAGSFLKQTKQPDPPRTFEEAVFDRYIQQTEDAPVITVGKNKFVERVGMDRVHARQKHVDQLTSIAVTNSRVTGAGNDVCRLSRCQRLDLGYNLLETIADVFEIVERIPSLQELLLNGNRFYAAETNKVIPWVIEVSLANTLVTSELVYDLLSGLPSLKKLTLCGNRWHDSDYETIEKKTQGLDSLDLSGNMLEHIPPKSLVRTLNLSENRILSTEKWSSPNTVTTELDLSNNLIASWEDVDNLSTAFPSVDRLRLSSNPLYRDRNADTYVIARFPAVQILNGTRITADERRDAELYFMSKVAKKEHPFNTSSNRWRQLCAIHGEPVAGAQADKSTIRSRLLVITVAHGSDSREFRVLYTMTVQKLRVLVANKFGLDPFSITLYTDGEEMNDFKTLAYYSLESGAIVSLGISRGSSHG